MGSRVFRTFCFFAILLCLLMLASFLFEPKNNREQDRVYYTLATGILAEPKDSIDVVFLGDSEAYCAFIPLQIWQEHGIPSYICSSLDQKLYETEEILDMVFQHQSPKMVILETNVLYRDYTSTDLIQPTLERYIPVFRYHDRWKNLHLADMFKPTVYTERSLTKGFYLIPDIVPANSDGYMADTDDVYPMPRQNLARLKRIQAKCTEHGAQLVMVSSPSTLNWSRMMFNYISPLANDLGIPYIDTNQLPEEVPIDWATDTKDAGDHLNYFGAAKLTHFIGNYLAETGLFTDKRADAAYSDWNSNVQTFVNTLQDVLASVHS